MSPPTNQFYIGWAENGEWCNYTVDVKKAGAFRIIALYANEPNTFKFSINNKPACECKFPVHTGSMHKWNKAEVGTDHLCRSRPAIVDLLLQQGEQFRLLRI